MTRSAHRRVTALPVAVLTVLAVVSAAGCATTESAVPSSSPVPSGSPAGTSLSEPVVDTVGGAVRGVVHPDHRLFQGIPYAAPPVGPLRWRPPQPVRPWPGVRDGERPGPWCIQPEADGLISEDCLSLNVWTPTGTAPAALPVLVWVHGGSFMKGSGDIYDARRLTVGGGIVVVTVNYRLGALGFLADPALGEPGNYGLADQQAALRWVRDNIAAFGGDPMKVTISGESAGGMSVCDHLAAPDSAGLFRAAIIQSGPCAAQADVAAARRISRDYAIGLGCPDQAGAAPCLRALPAEAFVEPLWYAPFGTDQLSGPVVGGRGLPVDPVTAIAGGRAARVPVLLGVNRDEFTMFIGLRYLQMGREFSAAEYPGVLAQTFGAENEPAVRAHYPPDRYGGSVSLALAAAITDDVFACVADRMAAGLAPGSPGVYGYQFDDPRAPAPLLYQQVPFALGASHSLEMRYLFDIGGDVPPLDDEQQRLGDQMVDYWTRFVAVGAPKAQNQPDWPAVDSDSGGDPWMSLRTDGSRVVTGFAADHQCPFWSGLRSSR